MIRLVSILLLGVAFLGASDGNLLTNPGFDDALESWHKQGETASMDAVKDGQRTAVRITVAAGASVSYPLLYQEFEAKPGDVLRVRLSVKSKGVRGGHGAYSAVEFMDAAEKRIAVGQGARAIDDNRWTEGQYSVIVPEKAEVSRVCLILNGRGEAYFDDVEVICMGTSLLGPLEGPVTLSVTEEVVCEGLIGFGGEDDGWFYTPGNKRRGVNEADIALNEARLKWLDPDWVRMFVWAREWCPSGDWKTFTWDNPGMESHYRTLDLYQEIGATVNITGVEWGMSRKMFQGDPEPLAKAFGELMEHLIRVKGYTCVRRWTLSNEPNGAFINMGGTFDFFVKIHELVRREFKRRGLDIAIVGSDDAQDLAWFKRCVGDEAYFNAVDLFASHRYFRVHERGLIPSFYDERIGMLRGRKPLVVGEFGFQDERSAVTKNPIMTEYRYAPWTAAFIIDGLNRGVAGFSIWTLHEFVYSGGGHMTYGLWGFKDTNWQVKPVYHAMAMFTRLAEGGDAVRMCKSSHPNHVKAALVGDVLFWVNLSEQSVEVTIKGFDSREVRIMDESTIHGDRECGVVVEPDARRFTAPPMSFGFARQ